MSITLRAVRKSDVPWIDAWLAPVAASVGFRADNARELTADDARSVAVIVRDALAVGLIAHRLAGPDAAIVELVATTPPEARRGAGMQAAKLLEASLRKRSVGTIYAPVPEVHGIAMYFWIRLGYRPLLREDWPVTCDGVVWLRRDIASSMVRVRKTAANRESR